MERDFYLSMLPSGINRESLVVSRIVDSYAFRVGAAGQTVKAENIISGIETAYSLARIVAPGIVANQDINTFLKYTWLALTTCNMRQYFPVGNSFRGFWTHAKQAICEGVGDMVQLNKTRRDLEKWAKTERVYEKE